MLDLITDVKTYQSIKESLYDFFRERCLILLKEGKINKGEYNKKREETELISIHDFYIDGYDLITTCGEVYWGGDIYDKFSMKLSAEEWKKINTKS